MPWDQILGQATGMEQKVFTDNRSSTTFGYINNAGLLRLPGQPGNEKTEFSMRIADVAPDTFSLEKVNFDCGRMMGFCIGRTIGNTLYNLVIRNMLNIFLQYVNPYITATLIALLQLPLSAIFSIFKSGLQFITKPGVNPILGLGLMGENYINFVMEYPIMMAVMVMADLFIPVFGIFVAPLLLIVGPITTML